jgi:transposase-like protein
MHPRSRAPTRPSIRRATRSASRLSPIKPAERCPHCNSKRLIKKGTRKKKLEDIPLYRCRSCGRTFSIGPRAIRNKTYPLPEILEAFTFYDRGNTLEATAEKISSRYGHRVAPSTISRWLAEHPALTTYRRLRDRGRRLFTPTQVVRTHKLYHRQIYEFAYHRAKLAFLKNGTLDDKRAARASSASRFSALADFIESIPQTCPHDLFSREDGARSSQLSSDFISTENLVVIKRQNAATDMAALILPAVGSNYERHPKLQRFMLANDSTTIAVEVPVWLTHNDIAAIENQSSPSTFLTPTYGSPSAASLDAYARRSFVPHQRGSLGSRAAPVARRQPIRIATAFRACGRSRGFRISHRSVARLIVAGAARRQGPRCFPGSRRPL